MPSFWIIQHLEFEMEINGKKEKKLIAGSAKSGIPFILIGRTNNISWGITAAITDVSDLYRETLSDDGSKY